MSHHHTSLNIAMVVGEASGDALAASFLRAIAHQFPQAHFFGIGGPQMRQEHFECLFEMESISTMGISEVIPHLPRLLFLRQQIIRLIINRRPHVFIGIDAPDFNFHIEKTLHREKIPIVHYVSPSVWAWRAKRVDRIAQFVDEVLCLFPMEPALYQAKGVHATFVGHPLASQIDPNINQHTSRHSLQLKKEQRLITLMPGSRHFEIQALAPIFFSAAKQLVQTQTCHQFTFALLAVNNKAKEQLQTILAKCDATDLPLIWVSAKDKYLYLSASDLVWVASGTATLEVALCRCPMVVLYKLSVFSYVLPSRLVHPRYISLPNNLLDKAIVPELIQHQANVQTLLQATTNWFNSSDKIIQTKEDFARLHQILRQDTDQLSVQAISHLINQT